MTTIKVSKKNGKFMSISAKGHTGYGEEGFDILCASVSSLIQSTALGLKTYVDKKIKLTVDEKTPFYKIDVSMLTNENYLKGEILLDTLVLSLKDLTDGYPENLKMEVKNDVY